MKTRCNHGVGPTRTMRFTRRSAVAVPLVALLSRWALGAEDTHAQDAPCAAGECHCACPEMACLLFEWGQRGDGEVSFLIPLGLASGPDSTLYLADYHGGQVFRADAT